MTTKRKTVGEMEPGDIGYVYPSKILRATLWTKAWIDPAEPLYNSSEIGAMIKRTESGYRVRLFKSGGPSRPELTDSELQEAGYIEVDDYQ